MKVIDKEEDLVLIIKTIAELSRQFEISKEAWTAYKENKYDKFYRVDDEGNEVKDSLNIGKCQRYHCLVLTWSPHEDPNSSMQHIQCVGMRWTPAEGVFKLYMSIDSTSSKSARAYNNINISYSVGFLPNHIKHHRQLKKNYLKLFHKVLHYLEVETPRRDREKAASIIYEAFPSMMDDMLLGNDDDDK